MSTAPAAVILMYHRVAEVAVDPWGLCVSPVHFATQLEAITQVAVPMSLQGFLNSRFDGKLPARSVVVTFDDGYLDNFEQALPLLRAHSVPATLFVTTGNIDTAREFWWDQLESIMLVPGRLPDRLNLSLPDGVRCWQLGAAAEVTVEQLMADRDKRPWAADEGSRLRLFFDVWSALWPLSAAQREAALDALAAWAGPLPSPAACRRTLTSQEIRDIAGSGLVSIGAHTVDHPPLPARQPSEQLRQIRGSKQRLQELLDTEIDTFAYPHGEYSSDTVDLLRKLGFNCAVTVEHQPVGRHTDPMLLPRYGVEDVAGEFLASQLDVWFAS
jgi:peptidoglycan/xylan/chitin deacetylase (PgdA/CDA1 family)